MRLNLCVITVWLMNSLVFMDLPVFLALGLERIVAPQVVINSGRLHRTDGGMLLDTQLC